jgi:hypothetical protein
MEECKSCKCATCSYRMDENFEKVNKLDCTICSWCKGDLIKNNCNYYNNKISEVNNEI